jgi:UDP-2-acetamido-3-amino-2,3-dideoxy-glucuronate N-acetyltransferase
MIHPLSDVQSTQIGTDTSIWQFTIILRDAVIGSNCNINSHCFVENQVVIGNNVTVKCGVHIWDGITIEDDVFIGPSVVFTNDLRPRSKVRVEYPKTVIGQGASIGANSTILAGVKIGKYAMAGIGSVITRDVPDHALVYGNPAKIRGWIGRNGSKLEPGDNDILLDNEGTKYKITTQGLIEL